MGDSWEDLIFGTKTSPAPATPAVAPVIDITDREQARRRRYAEKALAAEADNVRTAAEGSRNHTLNTAAFNLQRFVTDGILGADEIHVALTDSALANGLTINEIHATLRSAGRGAEAKRSDKPAVPPPTDNGHKPNVTEVDAQALTGGPKGPGGRSLRRIVAADIAIATPEWAWECNGHGRIQKGTLTIFAGRPGAGKSSAARWFAAKATQGKLRGCWDGEKLNVAYIAGEEPWEYVIAPGLVAAGADMRRVYTYDALDSEGRRTRLLSNADEDLLTEQFLADGIKYVIVDPLMSTISSVADVHRNNEVRDYIEPWARIAQRIDGVVNGIAHLRKNTSGDAVSLITGSSAFGEVARSVFAFVKDPDSDEGERVMSQAKNSTGYEDLALTYRIEPVPVTAADGTVAEVGRFTITGDSDVTAEQVLAGGGGEYGEGAECRKWLRDFLEEEGRAQAKDVLKAARDAGGWGERMVYRQQKKLKVCVESSSSFPRTTWWSLGLS